MLLPRCKRSGSYFTSSFPDLFVQVSRKSLRTRMPVPHKSLLSEGSPRKKNDIFGWQYYEGKSSETRRF